MDKKISPVRESIKYCFRQIKQYKRSYLPLSVINVIIGAAAPFSELIFLPLAIDALMAEEKNVPLILFYFGIMTTLTILLQGSNSVLSIHLAKCEDLFLNASSREISARCMEIDFSLTEDKAALDQIKKAREGIQWSGGTHQIAGAFFTIISNVIKIFGVIAVLIINAPILLIIIGVLLVLSAIINARKNDIDIKNFTELSGINRIFGHICWEMEDFRYGKDVRLYSAAGMMLEKTSQQIKRLSDYWENINRLKFPLNILDIIVGVLRDFGTYLYLGALAILGKISIGTFSQMLSAGGTLHSSLQAVIMGAQDIAKRSNYMYEIIRFMDYPPAMEKGSRKIENINGGHEIEFKNVCFSYPKTGVAVLKDVSIKIKAGEKLSVVGLNGAGKTTFIKLLCRLYDVDSGEILLDGVNIRDYDYDEYMKLFSVVFQDFRLLAFSAEDNILLGRHEEGSDKIVDDLFEKTGILEKIKSLPKGRDTMMFKQFDKDGVELSGGQQQKMAIARALYKDAPVIILDEPTAALDPVAEYEIYRQFNSLVNGKTAVYISHRLSSCKFCDNIAVFSEGTVKEYGTHDELVHKTDGIYAEMFKAQAQYYV
ncbi:MAG: ABC transporter ATP-binding protein/permease [Oscillospiraceae bacterium]|nr:ABC transporter ATP-binding protein/permease [Oscillospiraceae bacterium]